MYTVGDGGTFTISLRNKMLKRSDVCKILAFMGGDNNAGATIKSICDLDGFPADCGRALAVCKASELEGNGQSVKQGVQWTRCGNGYVSNSLDAVKEHRRTAFEHAVLVVVVDPATNDVQRVTSSFEEYMFGSIGHWFTYREQLPEVVLHLYLHSFSFVKAVMPVFNRMIPPAAAVPKEAYTVDDMLNEAGVSVEGDPKIPAGSVSATLVMKYASAMEVGGMYRFLSSQLPYVFTKCVGYMNEALKLSVPPTTVQRTAFEAVVSACSIALGMDGIEATVANDVVSFNDSVWASRVTRTVFVEKGRFFVDAPLMWYLRLFAMPLGLADTPKSLARLPRVCGRVVLGRSFAVVESEEIDSVVIRSFAANYLMYVMIPRIMESAIVVNAFKLIDAYNRYDRGGDIEVTLSNIGAARPFKSVYEAYCTAADAPSPPKYSDAGNAIAIDADAFNKRIQASLVPASDCMERLFGTVHHETRKAAVIRASSSGVQMVTPGTDFTHAYIIAPPKAAAE